MDLEKDFSAIQLTTGKTVALRPRTWKEYDDFERQRFADMERLAALTGMAFETERQRVIHGLRGRLLAACVKDFDALAPCLTLREVEEAENAVLELERVAVPLGNSGPGGAGQATAGA